MRNAGKFPLSFASTWLSSLSSGSLASFCLKSGAAALTPAMRGSLLVTRQSLLTRKTARGLRPQPPRKGSDIPRSVPRLLHFLSPESLS